VIEKGIQQGGKIGGTEQQKRNRTHQHYQDWAIGNGVKTVYWLTKTPRDTSQLAVYVNGLRKRPKERATAYDFSLSENRVTFVVAPPGPGPPGPGYVCFDIISS